LSGAFYVSLSFSFLFFSFFNTLDQILVRSHEFATQQVNLAFIGIIVGGFLGFAPAPSEIGFTANQLAGSVKPEARLLFTWGQTLLFASGLI